MHAGSHGDAVGRIAAWIGDRFGLHFPPARRVELERALRVTGRDFELPDMDELVDGLLAGGLPPAVAAALIAQLTVPETYFFRDRAMYEELAGCVLAPLLDRRRHSGRRLSVWSAGCASGEEPYSVAITLRRMLGAEEGWHVHVLGTDVNADAIERAERASYREWSFREGLPGPREAYFVAARAGEHVLRPEIRASVRFARHNLADLSLPEGAVAPFDVILCRNVLMYLREETARAVVRQFHRWTSAGGWLVVAPAEMLHPWFEGFAAVQAGSASFLRKTDPDADLSQAYRGRPVRSGAGRRNDDTPPPAASRESRSAEAARERRCGAADGEFAQAERSPQPGCPAAAPEKPRSRVGGARRRRLTAARAAADLGDLETALACCDAVIAADRLAVDARHLRAAVLEEGGDSGAAVQELQRILYLDQGAVGAHVALVRNARRIGLTRLAERHRKAAIRLLETLDAGAVLADVDGRSADEVLDILRRAAM